MLEDCARQKKHNASRRVAQPRDKLHHRRLTASAYGTLTRPYTQPCCRKFSEALKRVLNSRDRKKQKPQIVPHEFFDAVSFDFGLRANLETDARKTSSRGLKYRCATQATTFVQGC